MISNQGRMGFFLRQPHAISVTVRRFRSFQTTLASVA